MAWHDYYLSIYLSIYLHTSPFLPIPSLPIYLHIRYCTYVYTNVAYVTDIHTYLPDDSDIDIDTDATPQTRSATAPQPSTHNHGSRGEYMDRGEQAGMHGDIHVPCSNWGGVAHRGDWEAGEGEGRRRGEKGGLPIHPPTN